MTVGIHAGKRRQSFQKLLLHYPLSSSPKWTSLWSGMILRGQIPPEKLGQSGTISHGTEEPHAFISSFGDGNYSLHLSRSPAPCVQGMTVYYVIFAKKEEDEEEKGSERGGSFQELCLTLTKRKPKSSPLESLILYTLFLLLLLVCVWVKSEILGFGYAKSKSNISASLLSSI